MSETEEPPETAPGHTQKIDEAIKNELERKLRLEKVVASKHLRLAVETEQDRRARLENEYHIYNYSVDICV